MAWGCIYSLVILLGTDSVPLNPQIFWIAIQENSHSAMSWLWSWQHCMLGESASLAWDCLGLPSQLTTVNVWIQAHFAFCPSLRWVECWIPTLVLKSTNLYLVWGWELARYDNRTQVLREKPEHTFSHCWDILGFLKDRQLSPSGLSHLPAKHPYALPSHLNPSIWSLLWLNT